VLAAALDGLLAPAEQKPRDADRGVRTHPARNELKHVVGGGAEYRVDMQAGAALGLAWHLHVHERVGSPDLTPARGDCVWSDRAAILRWARPIRNE
jgi:hypothetical protein